MRILANSEDLDELAHNAAFHLGYHFLQRQKRKNTIFHPVSAVTPQWTIPRLFSKPEGRTHWIIKGL